MWPTRRAMSRPFLLILILIFRRIIQAGSVSQLLVLCAREAGSLSQLLRRMAHHFTMHIVLPENVASEVRPASRMKRSTKLRTRLYIALHLNLLSCNMTTNMATEALLDR